MKSPIDNFVPKLYPNGSVTQWFGENPSLYARFGMNGHNGIDIVAPWGSPIYAVEGGKVVDVKNDPTGYGKYIRIVTQNEGINNEWTYGHASINLVSVGDIVLEGQAVQLMGNTGFVVSGATPFWKYNPYAGTHLHLGLRKFEYSDAGWTYTSGDRIVTLNYNNGFKGSVDFKEMFVVDDEAEKIKALTLTRDSLINEALGLAKKLLAILKSKI